MFTGFRGLIEQVVGLNRQMVEHVGSQRKSDGDRKFKVEQKLKLIGSEDDFGIIGEIDAFEVQMAQGEVTWKNFYRYFEQALQGRALT